MKKIYLSGKNGKDKFVLVDDDDYEKLSRYKWCWSKGYALRSYTENKKRIYVFMHRQILGLNYSDKVLVDHINFDRLDNRKENLRLCSVSENARHQNKHKDSKSKYKGVYHQIHKNRWEAYILGKYLGSFKDEILAAKCYDKFAKELYKQFAELNFPDNFDYQEVDLYLQNNKKQKTSKYKGISLRKKTNRWCAYYTERGKTIFIGTTYLSEEEAFIARENFIGNIKNDV